MKPLLSLVAEKRQLVLIASNRKLIASTEILLGEHQARQFTACLTLVWPISLVLTTGSDPTGRRSCIRRRMNRRLSEYCRVRIKQAVILGGLP